MRHYINPPFIRRPLILGFFPAFTPGFDSQTQSYYKESFERKGYQNIKTFAKETLVPGNETTFPKDGQTVLFHYTVWFLDGREFDTTRKHRTNRKDGQPCQLTLGTGSSTAKGLEFALKQMSKGERATVVLSPSMAFGKDGNQSGTIPPDTTLVWDIVLLDIR